MGCSRPLIFPGESRDKLPRQGGKEAPMQPPPRGFGFFTASLHEAAGHKLPD